MSAIRVLGTAHYSGDGLQALGTHGFSVAVEEDGNLSPDDLRSATRLEQAVIDTDLTPDDLRSETTLGGTDLFVLLEPEDLRSATRLQNITTPLVPDDLRSAARLDQAVPSLAPFDLRSSTRLDSIALRRPIDSGAQDEVDKASGVAVTHVMEIHYEQAGTDKVLRLTTANQPIDVTVEGSEQTFTATPTNVLRIGTVEVSSDMAAQGVELTLGGVDRTFISLVMADDVHFRGRLVKLWRVYMDPDTGEVSAVVPSSENGWLFHINDTIEFEENWGGIGEPGTVTVKTRIVSRLAVLQQPTPVMTNMDSHNEMLERAGVLGVGDSRDEFFRRLPPLIGKRFRWGDSYPDV